MMIYFMSSQDRKLFEAVIFSQFWKLKVQGPGINRVGFLWAFSFQPVGGRLLTPCHHMAFPMHKSIFAISSFSYKDTGRVEAGLHPYNLV